MWLNEQGDQASKQLSVVSASVPALTSLDAGLLTGACTANKPFPPEVGPCFVTAIGSKLK